MLLGWVASIFGVEPSFGSPNNYKFEPAIRGIKPNL